MSENPTLLVSSLSSTKYTAGKFWLTRLLSVLAVVAGLYLFHTMFISGSKPMLGRYDQSILYNCLIFAILAVSLNLINGITGQFSMGHAAFYLTGAIVAGKVSTTFFKDSGMEPWQWVILMTVVGGVAAAIAGLLVGVPSLRLRGDYLAVMTMGFGEIARVLVINQDGKAQSIMGLDLGGSYGLQNVPKQTQIFHLIVLLIIAIAVCRNLLKTHHGLAYLAVREDELASGATGVNTTRIKVAAFVIGAAIAGMAGALFAHYNRSVNPDDFKMDVSFMLVAMVVIGGTGSITGAAIAGFSLKMLEEALRELSVINGINFYSWILGAVLVLVLVSMFRKRLEAPIENTKLKLPCLGLGSLGMAGLLYLGFLVQKSNVSVVIKTVGIAIIVVSLLGMLMNTHRLVTITRFGFFVMSVFAMYVLSKLSLFVMNQIPSVKDFLGKIDYQAADLRWAIFSAALVLVMIMRPQGIMSHHEFSWMFVKNFFKRKTKQEVAA